jgi:hypothetical protein
VLYATIRTSHEAIHFIGAVGPCSVQTLQGYMRSARREAPDVQLHVELGAEDEGEFNRHAQRWLGSLKRCGVRVDVRVDPGEPVRSSHDTVKSQRELQPGAPVSLPRPRRSDGRSVRPLVQGVRGPENR